MWALLTTWLRYKVDSHLFLNLNLQEVYISGRYNEKADVYSYGILLAELFNDSDPFAHLAIDSHFDFIKVAMHMRLH